MITVSQCIQHFISHCIFEKNLSSKTIIFYKIDLAQFSAFIGKENVFQIERVTKHELRSFLGSMSALKPKSIRRKMATLNALFNYLEFDDKLEVNPMRKIKLRLKEPRTLPNVLELTEIDRMLKLLYRKRQMLTSFDLYAYKEITRNIVVIELLFATGCRVSEIAKLRKTDLDLDSGVVHIKGKGGKERIVQVCNSDVLSLLKSYKELWLEKINDKNYFLINRFGNGISEQSIRNLVVRLSKAAGIGRKITPHVFRHSFATLLLEKDVDIKYIQSLLGHSSIVTTQIYTHVNKIKQRQLLTARHPRMDISPSEPSVSNAG